MVEELGWEMVVAEDRDHTPKVLRRCGIDHKFVRAGAGECYAPRWAVTLCRLLQAHMGHLGLAILEHANEDEEFRRACMSVVALARESSPAQPSDGWAASKLVEYAADNLQLQP